MKLGRYFLFILLFLSSACSTDTVTDDTGAGSTSTSTTTAAGSIAVTATPSTVSALGTVSITATVLDGAGANVADGTAVSFAITTNASLGTISPTATTVSGVATGTFTAAAAAGSAVITVSAGGASATTSIVVLGVDVGSIQFTSATPNVIGVTGSGQTETSIVSFSVKDINGQPASDGTSVVFTLFGPNGGESITPTTASTVAGVAKTTLQSGSVPGPVTFVASVTIGANTLTSSSTPISIGGGIPSAKHFNLATTRFNLPGLVISNSKATITVFIADRFSNFNVLEGTSVSFRTEAGAIDRSAVTDSTGIASVVLRTQAPNPADVALPAGELATITTLNGTYSTAAIPTDGSAHPSDGHVTVIAALQGEEAFVDANANGRFDTTESFTDIGEPFVDSNNDGCRNDGVNKNCGGVISASSDPLEEYIDANGDGSYNSKNGIWDGPGCTAAGCQKSKMIWDSILLAFTGHASRCHFSGNTTVPADGSRTFSVMVGDINVNQLVPGTAFSVVLEGAGKLIGGKPAPLADVVSSGPTQFQFTIADAKLADTDPGPEPFTATVKVTSPEVVGCEFDVSGTVN